MKVTISGASGFVGKNLKKKLNESHKVDSISVRYVFNQVFKVEGDIFIHLAGKAHDLKKISNPNDYYDANFELTKQIFDSFLESECRDFIYFSSVKAVADDVSGVLLENTKENPITSYGKSKLKAEKYINSKVILEDKRVFIIRPCMIHGPGNKGNLNLLYKVVNKRIPYPLGAFYNERSFLGIDNLVFLIEEIIKNKQIPSGVYNFADDEFLSTNELVQIISSVLNKKNLSIAVPTSIINGFAKLGDWMKLPLNSETVKKMTENYRVSNEKIKAAIGIDILPNTAKEGLEKTIKSFMIK